MTFMAGLYQGTSSDVPLELVNDSDFSPCNVPSSGAKASRTFLGTTKGRALIQNKTFLRVLRASLVNRPFSRLHHIAALLYR